MTHPSWRDDVEACVRRGAFVDALEVLRQHSPQFDELVGELLKHLSAEQRFELALTMLTSPRSSEWQAFLERTALWPLIRQLAPSRIACTYLTLFHPPAAQLSCSECGSSISASTGVIGRTIELCAPCIRGQRSMVAKRCALCCDTSVSCVCKVCAPQVEALLKRSSTCWTRLRFGV